MKLAVLPMTRVVTGLLLLGAMRGLFAQDVPADLEARLVPLAVRDVPGAFGSRWSATLVGLNGRDGVLVYGLNYVNPVLPLPAGLPWSASPIPTRDFEAPGSIIYVPKEASDDVNMAIVIRQDGASLPDEISMPVVRQSEFVSRPIYFLGLQDNVDERTHLRVYSLDLHLSRIAVRFQILAPNAQFTWRVVHDATIDLDVKQRTSLWPYDRPLPVRPWATQIALDPLFDASRSSGPYIIVLTPLTDGAKLWAFVSETDNTTQHIQLMFSQ